jgi:hypothetical protein
LSTLPVQNIKIKIKFAPCQSDRPWPHRHECRPLPEEMRSLGEALPRWCRLLSKQRSVRWIARAAVRPRRTSTNQIACHDDSVGLPISYLAIFSGAEGRRSSQVDAPHPHGSTVLQRKQVYRVLPGQVKCDACELAGVVRWDDAKPNCRPRRVALSLTGAAGGYVLLSFF